MPRPIPNAADLADAERFIAEAYDADPKVCRTWLAEHRAELRRQAAVAAMQKRMHLEQKAAFAPERRAAA